MKLLMSGALLIVGLSILVARESVPARKATLIAHRGASGYAPEHTHAAYELAIAQGADYVEQDLQMTRDGALVCSHDAELSRTTNIATVFPDRATLRDPGGAGTPKRGWYAVDFTLEELKRLDAGSWFNRANPFAARKEFEKQKLLTLEEAIATVGTRAGFYIETKHVEFYNSLGLDMVGNVVGVLRAYKLMGPPSSRPRVIIQSFLKQSLVRLRGIAPELTRVQLLPMQDAGRRENTQKITGELAAEIAGYAHGAGPDKSLLTGASDVAMLHKAGLIVHPYTFRGSTTAVVRRPLTMIEPNGRSLRDNIISDMRHYLDMGIDGGFTDYPNLWRATQAK